MSDTSKPSLHDNDALLTYRVGPVLCCGPTLPVVTIIPPPALTQLPGTNIAEPGIFKHGTYIVSATDLRHRFGVKQENWNQPAKVIIAQHDDLKLTRGYFVDEIKDVIRFPEKGWGQLPTHLPRGVFSRTLLLNDHIYLYAEFEKLSQLQGTGYLTDYIIHLEKLEEEKKQAVTKSTAKSSIEKQTTSTLKTSEKQINTSQVKSSSLSSSSKAEAELPIIEEVTSEAQISTEPNKFNLDKPTPDKPNSKKSNPDKSNNEISTALANEINKKLNESATKVSEKISETIDKGTIKKSTINIPPATSQPTPSKLKVGLKANHTHDKTNSTENASIKNTIDSLPSKTTTKTDIKSVQEFSSENYPNDKVTAKNKSITPDISKDESSIFPIFIIFLFLFLIAAAVYFALNYSSGYLSESSPVENEKPLARSYKDTSTTYTDNKTTALPDTNIITESDDQTKKEIIANQSINKIKSSESESNNIGINVAPLDSSNGKSTLLSTKDTKNEYHASIQHDDDTITIELDGPLPPQINTDKLNNIDKISSEKSNAIDFSEPENEAQQPTDEIKIVIEPSESKEINTQTSSIPKNIQQDTNSFEIVHIIVKGDTLWAIAKYYLLNPYRYPELAKLSKIHNPDLIYPGNRVRIIYKKSSNK